MKKGPLKRWLAQRRRERLMREDGAPEVIFRKAEITENRIDLYAQHPAFAAFAEETAQMYEKHGGPNYLEFTLYSDRGIYTVTIAPRKVGVKTQSAIIAELKKRIAELEAGTTP